MEKNKILTAVHLFLTDEEENKILLARRYNTGYEDGKYSLIAGHVDEKETVREAIIRESDEEAGIALKKEDLEIRHVMHRRREKETELDRIDFFIKALNWTGTPRIMEEDKCDEMKWFKMNDLPENIIPYIKFAIKEFQMKSYYSEFGW